MKETTTKIELTGESLVDVDVLADGSYIAITTDGNVIFPFHRFRLPQTFKYPIIRLLSDNSFLVADSRTDGLKVNCFTYDLNGNNLMSFFAGDGIQDIEVCQKKIVVTYFDEGVFGSDGPNNFGLVVFDVDGKILFRYNENRIDNIIADCYCLCKHGDNRILFFPYTDFRLTELNVDTKEVKVCDVPEQVKGSHGLTSTNDEIIFHSPYDDNRGLYKWTKPNKEAVKIGEYVEGLRGLTNGRFLSKGERGFTIIDLT